MPSVDMWLTNEQAGDCAAYSRWCHSGCDVSRWFAWLQPASRIRYQLSWLLLFLMEC